MALVRVYCGLVSAYPPRQLAVGSSSLYVTIVDDAGRGLDVCEIGDDPYGYAYLSALLAERATGPYSVAIATNSDQRLVPRLLAAAGWALAVVDDDATDDFADRFTDEFQDGADTGPTRRRALGLARALQGGVLSATLMPVPPELVELKPVLAALGALATGRHASSVALREVLRELYPAALRAYPDPADPVALAVMDAVPEPGVLGSATGWGRDAAAAADAVTARLASTGLADQSAITEAITALRVAIAETPRRGAISRALTATVAETVRQAVAAVRSYDSASTALVNALAERVSPAGRHAAASAQAGSATPAAAAGPVSTPAAPAPAAPAPAAPAPAAPAPAAPAPAAPRSRTAIPRATRAPVSAGQPAAAADGQSSPPPPRQPAAPPGRRSAAQQPPPVSPAQPAPPSSPLRPAASLPPPPPPPMSAPPQAPPPLTPPPVAPAPVTPPPPLSAPTPASAAPPNRPVSPPPPPPPGITPITEPRTPLPSRSRSWGPSSGDQVRVPTPRPTLDGPPRGSRADWPTNPPADDWAASASPPAGRARRDTHTNGSSPPPVTPPWRADDLKPPEPPALRLVEPTLPDELKDDLDFLSRSDSPPLRLVDSGRNGGMPRSAPPVSADEDNTLLIFEQTRSAWFIQDEQANWNSAMDLGWQAAEQAAHPTVGDRTEAGLPRRVPHANLVPGAPPRRDDRPLRVVRNPASIAENTSGYFNGWRRGQEVGGYPLGGRQRRPSAGAWEFHRDEDRLSG